MGAIMVIFSWDGVTNLDLKVLGQEFDFRSDVLQISDPSLAASQFDLVEIGTDLAVVKSRDAAGAPLAAADVRYAYIPNMIIRQIGVDAEGASQNIVLSNGGQLWAGDRMTDTVLDDQANLVPLDQALQSVQVWGLGGADTIATGQAADRVYGNTGADSILGGAGNDSLYGGQENDTVLGGGGNDQVAGDLGDDSLLGGAGNDVLYGGAGNDVLDPDTGNDTIFAGNGNDTLELGDSDTGDKLVYMDRMQDLVTISSTTGDHIVYLGDHNDEAQIIANAGDIQIFGEGGNDVLVTQSLGSDTLDGGEDDDALIIAEGAIGHKVLIGGNGDDILIIADTSGIAPSIMSAPRPMSIAQPTQANTQADVSAGEGEDTIYYARGLFIQDANDGGTGEDMLIFGDRTNLVLRDLSIRNVETVVFGEDSDRVVFADGNVSAGMTLTVYGELGDDVFDGSAESDGHYLLLGGAGEDSLVGGAQADTLNGGESADTLKGGGDGDLFVQDWLPMEGSHPDTIVDFTTGLDTLAFDGNVFGGISGIVGYKGGADGAPNAANLLISTDRGYADETDFNNFLAAGSADNGKPGFYVFFNTTSGRGEIWFDEDMTDTTGAVLVVTLDNVTSTVQLAQLDAGSGGPNSGDFVIL
ncbi:hypothetical protein STVA_25220 [Allostella vacuolata]|nr:hypothetical protein STVA_25220 [Stella vacuolata]